MANVLALLKPVAQPSMNGFDLSQKHVYDSSSGRIDSPLQVETVPKDKFQLDVACLMRTMTFQTPAFLRGKVTYDFYFVPYSQIWHPFNQFIQQRKDVHSSNQKGIKFCPVVNLGDLLLLAFDIYKFCVQPSSAYDVEKFKDIHGYCWSLNLFRMLDYFGYGNYYYLRDAMVDANTSRDSYIALLGPIKEQYVNIFRAAAYQHVWYDYYRNKFYDNYEYQDGNYMSDYVLAFNFDDVQCDTFANSILPISFDNLESADNLRIIQLFTQRYCQYKQDLFQSALPTTQFGVVSSVEVNLDALVTDGDYYLNTNSAQNFTNPSYVIDEDGNYAANKDLMTGSSGDVIVASGGVSQMARIESQHDHSMYFPERQNRVTASSTFDVLALKRAEALQKWRQNALRAGNMVDDGFRAHYGVTPRYESDNNALKLGSFEGSLQVNGVEATASSSQSVNGQVGDMGATGTCVIQGKKINFECRDFGVIVCMQFFRPESEYSSTMIDKANRLNEPFDFFTEEFQNMGLDPVTMADYSNTLMLPNVVLGYAAQYWWYKQAVDKVHGEFAKYYYRQDATTAIDTERVGSKTMWVAPRQLDLVSRSILKYERRLSSLYVNPDVLDDVFDVHYSESLITPMEDQFHFNCYFDIKVFRPMSVVGLPNF